MPSPIMLSHSWPNLAVSPWAFWMSDLRPAASNAFCRFGRSWLSQRGEVVASGRITPTSVPPLEPPSPALLLLLLSLLPHAASAPNASTPVATSAPRRAVLLVFISSTSVVREQ